MHEKNARNAGKNAGKNAWKEGKKAKQDTPHLPFFASFFFASFFEILFHAFFLHVYFCNLKKICIQFEKIFMLFFAFLSFFIWIFRFKMQKNAQGI